LGETKLELLDRSKLLSDFDMDYRFIIVDDYQNFDVSRDMLIKCFDSPKTSIILFANPDAITDSYRGASHKLIADVLNSYDNKVEKSAESGKSGKSAESGESAGAFFAQKHVLLENFRLSGNIAKIAKHISGSIVLTPTIEHRDFKELVAPKDKESEEMAGGEKQAGGEQATRVESDGRMGGETQEGGKKWVRAGGEVNAASNITCVLTNSETRQVNYISKRIQSLLKNGVSTREIAIIARSSNVLSNINYQLSLSNIQTNYTSTQYPLSQEAVFTSIASIVELIYWQKKYKDSNFESASLGNAGAASLAETKTKLVKTALFSVLINSNIIQWRKILRSLSVENTVNPENLVWDLLLDKTRVSALPNITFAPIKKLSKIVENITENIDRLEKNPREYIYKIWALSENEADWKSLATQTNNFESSVVNHNLDVLIEVLNKAESYQENYEGKTIYDFFDFVNSQEISADSLTRRNTPKISLLTPQSALGQEFDYVFLTGLQDKAWPNLKIRDSLFAASELEDIILEKQVQGLSEDEKRKAKQRELFVDELRLLYVAATRAKRALYVVGIQAEDVLPSGFFSVFKSLAEESGAGGAASSGASEAGAGSDGAEASTGPASVGASTGVGVGSGTGASSAGAEASTGSAGVGASSGADSGVSSANPSVSDADFVRIEDFIISVRKRLLTADLPKAERQELVTSLAYATYKKESLSNPDAWYGIEKESTNEPLYSESEEVYISPSSFEKLESCPLRWAVESNGGEKIDLKSGDKNLGTLIHKIAELHPEGSIDELMAELNATVDLTPFADMLDKSIAIYRAKHLLKNIASYFAKCSADGIKPVAVEVPIKYSVGEGVHVSGKIDRIEKLPDGSIRVLDFKTTKKAKTIAETETDAQLTLYQLGIYDIVSGENPHIKGELKEAVLYYPEKGFDGSPPFRTQSALKKPEEVDEAEKRVRTASKDVRSSAFEAKLNKSCEYCNAKSLCPLFDEGRGILDV
jgi:superfamily I DNA/RNA helicase/RecB family exonuclease